MNETVLLDRARALATATIADALDGLGLPGILLGISRRSGAGRIAGYARTMQEQSAPYGSFRFEDFAVGSGFDAVGPDEILVADMSGVEISTLGGLAAETMHLRGAAGAVVDGGIRDIEEIRRFGFSVASRCLTPRSGKGRVRVIAIDEPVTCGGVCVRSADLIVLDDTGVIAIPASEAERVIAAAEQLDIRDRAFSARLKAGESFTAIAASLRHA
jgi:regulator of RNase E activity RraA